MRQPERSASSTSLTPSTPTNPFSVGSPPRNATRNSLSQRLSRLVRSAASLAGRALRAAFPGIAITVEGSKFLAAEANSQQPLRYRPAADRKYLSAGSYVSRLLLRGLQGYGSVAQIRAA